jgi:glycosyltransferase involved in cell wall biosynthesis
MGRYPNVGGVESVSTLLANRLAARGHSVSIVSFEQPMPQLAAKELNPAVKLYSLKFPVKLRSNLQEFSDILRQEHTDIIINQWALPWYVNRFINRARRGTNCRLVSVLHNKPDGNTRIQGADMAIKARNGFLPLLRLKKWAATTATRLSLRYVYRHSDWFTVLSDSFVPIFKQFIHDNDGSRLSALGNPLCIAQTSSIRPIAERNGFIYVGRVEENQKRVSRLVDIWQLLLAANPARHLTIVGDGPDLDSLKKQFAQRRLTNVEFVGYADPAPYYDRASILLMVSQYEGFGLVIIEAMSRGVVPVVLNSFTACADVIPNDSIGLKIPTPFEATAFADAINRLEADPSKLQAMSTDAIEWSKQFSPDAITDRWLELFNRLLNV